MVMPEIKNLKKAANRILKAIKNKERIILYGDSDLDGVSAVIIQKETIQSLGGKISLICFPDRETEGHGLTETSLKRFKKLSPALLITLDLGVGNFREIKLAKKMGFDIIVVDHHIVLDKIPDDAIVVDPKQKQDKYPFKEFAAVGLSFKLSELLLKDKITKELRKNFLELVALATIADMMPKEDENEIMIAEGLSTIENSWRPGIKAFFETQEIMAFPTLNQKISKIISILNVRDVKNGLPASFRLLNFSSMREARQFIEKLLEKSQIRKEKIKDIVEEVEQRIFGKIEPIVFEGSSDWGFDLISSVASIICREYKKPVFIYKKLAKETQGTVRSTKEIDSVALMKKCKKELLTFGGHPPASGFRIKNENLEKFKECLIRHL